MNKNKSLLHNDYLALLVRLVLGVVFIYASIDKIVNPAQFARVIYNYHLLPGDLINFAAVAMPWIEIFCGTALIAGIYKEGSVLVISGLLLIFAISITINLIRGVDLECGCFTVSSKAKSNALDILLRDLIYIAMGFYLYFNRSQKFCLVKTKY
jgi:uncharacterized membrane protein YphA (DoxX/SURF4 family)